jgi:hypothetical protein
MFRIDSFYTPTVILIAKIIRFARLFDVITAENGYINKEDQSV